MTQEGIDQLILITLFAFIVIGLITGSDNIRRIRHTIRRDKKKVSEMIKHPFKLRHAVELFKEIKNNQTKKTWNISSIFPHHL